MKRERLSQLVAKIKPIIAVGYNSLINYFFPRDYYNIHVNAIHEDEQNYPALNNLLNHSASK
jgi:hypothetical protein